MIGDWIDRHAATRPDATAFTSWGPERCASDVTFAELSRRVRGAALRLREMGIAPGDRVVTVLPNSIDFVAVFCAIIEAGGIAVPAPVPSVSRSPAFQSRLASILRDCAPNLLVTDAAWCDLLEMFAAVKVVAAEDVLRGPVPPGQTSTAAAGHRVVALQYTSGSTGDPKGVVLTEEMIEAHCRQASQVYTEAPNDTAVTWVPLFHDMGLLTGLLRPLRTGYRSILMPATDFVKQPDTWLRLISNERATLSSAPNFGYDLCVRRVNPARLEGVDLSSWRVARNAGETVLSDTLRRFDAAFAPHGFDSGSACPSYGLAEATLTVTTAPPGRSPSVLSIRRDDLNSGTIRETIAGDLELVSSGTPLPGTEVRIARSGGDGTVGEILVRGPQVFAQYWNRPRPERSRGFHPTGDLGFLWVGELYVLGRETDMLSVNGRNHHLHADVVPSLRGIPELRSGRVGVFTTAEGGRALVHLAAELKPDAEIDPAALDSLRARIRAALLQHCDMHLHRVHFCAAGELPVTTSGKVRLQALRDRYADGRLQLL